MGGDHLNPLLDDQARVMGIDYECTDSFACQFGRGGSEDNIAIGNSGVGDKPFISRENKFSVAMDGSALQRGNVRAGFGFRQRKGGDGGSVRKGWKVALFLLFGAKESNRIATQSLHCEHRIRERPPACQLLAN